MEALTVLTDKCCHIKNSELFFKCAPSLFLYAGTSTGSTKQNTCKNSTWYLGVWTAEKVTPVGCFAFMALLL